MTTAREARDIPLGHLAPSAQPGAPGVVMIHDVWELSDHYRDLAQRLSSRGFSVLAVDLYRRGPERPGSDPGSWMRDLSDPQVQADVEEAAAFLSTDAATRAPRVGVVGFCMGGMYALLAGCGGRGVHAVVPFYGPLSHRHGLLYDAAGLDPVRKPREPIAAAAGLQCPMLAFFGAEDDFIPQGDVEALRQAIRASGQDAELVVYPDAGHAFMNETRPDAYREGAALDAWERMVEFLEERLGAS